MKPGRNFAHATKPFVVSCTQSWPDWIIRMKKRNRNFNKFSTWWRHQMETFSMLLAFCEGNSPNIGQWREALMFSLICAWINGWVNNRDAGDLRRHCAHYDVTVMNNKRIISLWNWSLVACHRELRDIDKTGVAHTNSYYANTYLSLITVLRVCDGSFQSWGYLFMYIHDRLQHHVNGLV